MAGGCLSVWPSVLRLSGAGATTSGLPGEHGVGHGVAHRAGRLAVDPAVRERFAEVNLISAVAVFGGVSLRLPNATRPKSTSITPGQHW